LFLSRHSPSAVFLQLRYFQMSKKFFVRLQSPGEKKSWRSIDLGIELKENDTVEKLAIELANGKHFNIQSPTTVCLRKQGEEKKLDFEDVLVNEQTYGVSVNTKVVSSS
jgi:hypothetical protein